MNREMIIFSDAHFSKNPQKSYIRSDGMSSWLYNQIKIVDSIFDYAKSANVKTIIHNGDLFEDKNRIPQDLYNTVWELFKKYSDDFNIFFNTGNHDMFRMGGSSLKPFSDIVIVVSDVFSSDLDGFYIRMIPYGRITAECLKLPGTDKTKILLIHENVSGLEMGPLDYSSGTPLKPHIFGDWNFVVNGHIHKPQKLMNIINIGSVISNDWGEAGEEKRILHYKDGTMLSVPIVTPQFYLLDRLTDKLKRKIEDDNENFYRIDISPEQVKDTIFQKWNVFHNIIKSERREIRLKEAISVSDEVEIYVELSDTKLDKLKLIEIGKELIE